MGKCKRTLIWLGVGCGAQPQIDLSNYDNVILVDARNDCFEHLANHFSHENIAFNSVAIGEHTEKSQQLFTIYSIEEFSSLSTAKELCSLFPGLKEQKCISVDVVSATSFINKLKLPKASSDLILDIPDKAFGVIEDLIESGHIKAFQTIIVLGSEFELYEGMAPIALIRELLEQQFFELVSVDNSDPDIPYFTFSFSAKRYEINQLQSKLEQTNAELDSMREQLREATKEIQLNKQYFEKNELILRDKYESDKALLISEKSVLERNLEVLNERLNFCSELNQKLEKELTIQVKESGKLLDLLKKTPLDLKDAQLFFTDLQKSQIENGVKLATKCFKAKDQLALLEKISSILTDKNTSQLSKFAFCCKASQLFSKRNDELMAVHFINTATRYVDSGDNGQLNFELAQRSILLKKWDLAVDFSVVAMSKFLSNREYDGEHYLHAFTEIRRASKKRQQHGHDLLIEYINSNKSGTFQQKKQKTFVEIGTTREDIPGQGSTIQLATLCHELGIQFITVDMDPNNTQLATITMTSESLSGKAINQKGEDFLAEYDGQLDFVFLDAYDFDHGNHSELRQARYKKYLGHRIDEKECHVMHLKCAESLIGILSQNGVVCIDDTWRDEDGNWTAKGTLAVPFLLERGFEIIDERNRAVLLKRL